MSDTKDTVLEALNLALKNNPEDESLRLHIAKHLLAKNEAVTALEYFQQVLLKNPVQLDAVNGAHQAAILLEKTDLVNAYATLKQSLQPSSSTDEAKKDDVVTLATNNEGSEQKPDKRVRGSKLRLVSGEQSEDTWVDVEDSHIYLKDVGGMEDVKKRLNLAFLAPLQNPELMKAYGKSLSGGLMLYGPPGCGKTFIARALAGELGAKFISVGLTEILDMYVGESERKLHEIFESARSHAPVVLFFDELDAIGQKRSQLKNSGLRGLVNQLLAELDSIESENEGLFVLAATNHPWDVDNALRRPGRFDRIVPVFPPDKIARESILQYHMRKKPTDNLDLTSLAEKTHFFSGADLKYLCEVASEYAIEASIESGQIKPIDTNAFIQPLKDIRPSTRDWFETARNFAMFANDSGKYDDLLAYIKKHKL